MKKLLVHSLHRSRPTLFCEPNALASGQRKNSQRNTRPAASAVGSQEPARRSGTILVVIMLSLAMLSMTAAAMVRVSLLQRDMVQSNDLRVQAEWLFQSAVSRAASQLRKSSDYSGEKWTIPAAAIGGHADAVAEISVETSDSQTKDRTVSIRILNPPDDPNRATVSRSVSISP